MVRDRRSIFEVHVAPLVERLEAILVQHEANVERTVDGSVVLDEPGEDPHRIGDLTRATRGKVGSLPAKPRLEFKVPVHESGALEVGEVDLLDLHSFDLEAATGLGVPCKF